MHFSTIIAAALASASLTIGVPTFNGNAKRQASVLCSGLEATPQCCAVNVLNLADLNCADPPTLPTSVANFTDICAAIGQEAQCCAIPILEQGLICAAPQG